MSFERQSETSCSKERIIPRSHKNIYSEAAMFFNFFLSKIWQISEKIIIIGDPSDFFNFLFLINL